MIKLMYIFLPDRVASVQSDQVQVDKEVQSGRVHSDELYLERVDRAAEPASKAHGPGDGQIRGGGGGRGCGGGYEG